MTAQKSALRGGVPAFSTQAGNVFAGLLTALVFYAEYISLGASLGGQISGFGRDAGQALGSLLVLTSVWVCCLFAIVGRLPQPMLAGPRAASLLVMGLGLVWTRQHTQDLVLLSETATLALMVMLLTSGLAQLAGLHPGVRRRVQHANKALTRGFIFATAAGIVAGAVDKQLAGCLQSNFWLSTTIFFAGVMVGAGWMRWCDGSVERQRFKIAALPLGMALAWVGYALLLKGQTSATGCGTLGSAGLQWTSLVERLPDVARLSAAWQAMQIWHWLVLALLGLAMGLVQLIETLTALESTESTAGNAQAWPRYLAVSAAANLVCAPLALSCSSFSGARSTALAQAGAQSSTAVLAHGVALGLVVWLASEWIGHIPLLAIGVASALIAIQMIDGATQRQVWSPGYRSRATPVQVRTTWLFWLVTVVGVLSGQAIWGLVAASIALGILTHPLYGNVLGRNGK